MRLKFLFFPIMLVISLSIFIGYIWPVIGDLKTANTEKMSHLDALKAINEKKLAIDRIDGEISKDGEGESVINEYLPNVKVEERILTGVNFLATDSGVSLVSISLGNGSESSAATAATDSSITQQALVISDPMDVAGVEKISSVASNDLKFTQADIIVVGDYEKIRLFIDQVQKMPIFNSVKSISISSQSTQAAADEATDTNSLSANLVIDFGYMNTMKMDSQKIANFKPGLDSNTISVVKQYISKKSPAVDSIGNRDGKTNPFLQ